MSIPHRPIRKILCMRLRSMGDVVLMTPALQALRKGLPEAEIHVVLDQELVALFENHPHVDRVHELRRGNFNKARLAIHLLRSRFDAVLNFHGGPTSAWLALASGAPLRVGQATYRNGFVYNRKVDVPEKALQDPRATHTVHNQASLVTALRLHVQDFSLHLEVSDAALKRLSARPQMQQLSRPSYVVFQPTASFPSKQWPAEHFFDVARELKDRWDHEVVFSLPAARRLGRQESREERRADSEALTLSFLENLYAPEFPVLFDLPLDELMALMRGAALYVGNDSGPMHLATAFGKPVVGIFGSSDPKRWHPWGVPHRVIWAGLECSPCHGKSCANPDRFACVKAIEVKEVLKAALDLLEEKE